MGSLPMYPDFVLTLQLRKAISEYRNPNVMLEPCRMSIVIIRERLILFADTHK
jgi:hypothetical protein